MTNLRKSTLSTFIKSKHAEYISKGTTLTNNRLVSELKAKDPNFYKRYAKILDVRESGIPYHPRMKGYPTCTEGKAKIKQALVDFYVRRYIFIHGPLKCKHCGSTDGTIFKKIRDRGPFRYAIPSEYCSESCSKANEVTRARREATSLERYGVRNVTYCPEIRARTDPKLNDPDMIARRSAKTARTIEERYGSRENFYRMQERMRRKTNMVRYGGPAATCCPKVLRKRNRNHREKYGVNNPSQRPEIIEKIAKVKGRGRPSYSVAVRGKVFKGVQGYEAKAIKALVKYGVKARNIDVYKKGVRYTHRGKVRWTFPDLTIKNSEGLTLIVEVKSTYTVGYHSPYGVSPDGYANYPLLRSKFRGIADTHGEDCAVLLVYHEGKFILFRGLLPKLSELRSRIKEELLSL